MIEPVRPILLSDIEAAQQNVAGPVLRSWSNGRVHTLPRSTTEMSLEPTPTCSTHFTARTPWWLPGASSLKGGGCSGLSTSVAHTLRVAPGKFLPTGLPVTARESSPDLA